MESTDIPDECRLGICLYKDLPYTQTGELKGGYISWIQDWSTNLRYYVSTLTQIPFFSWEAPSFSPLDTITMLGQTYSFDMQDDFQDLDDMSNPKVEEFMRVYSSIIWSTYRTNFRPIKRGEAHICSDTGWGCTIRAGQMLLLQSLQVHFNCKNAIFLLQMIQENIQDAPFSIHKVTEKGKLYGKLPGDWYAPSTICLVLSKLCKTANIPGLQTKTFMDSFIYKNVLRKDKSLLLMMPIMLGLGGIQDNYFVTIKYFLGLKWCVGIIGGKPRSALYIVGYQNDNLLCLDPHLAVPSIKSHSEFIDNFNSYFNNNPKMLPINRAESSMAIGLYFQNYEEFLEFENELQRSQEFVMGVISVQESEQNVFVSDISYKSDSNDEDDYVLL